MLGAARRSSIERRRSPARTRAAAREEVAAVLSIAPGYDPKYLTRAVGKGAENYYLSAVAEHGEPPGRWWGQGAAALGLEPGSEIDGATMELLYEGFLDPRDPNFADASVPDEEKARLGRRKQQFKSWEEIYAKKAASEPEASPERLEQLRAEAKGESRQAVVHHDATFSPTKSVTLVHAGLMAAAARAEDSGDVELATQYRQAADVVWEGVNAGAEASLRYLQEHAGEARVGYHGAKVAGRTTGRWMEAGGWVVGRFAQHTNRDNDPQLHIHQAILNRQLCADGKWRALDGMAIYRARPAAAAHGERVMEEHLTRRLGLQFRSRPDGQGREVVGVSPELIAEFSTRRAAVTRDLEERVAAYVDKHGRQPSPRTLFKLAQDATKDTKNPKVKGAHAPSPAEQLRQWEERTTAAEVDQLSTIPGKTLGRINPAATPAPDLAAEDVDRVIAAAVADVQVAKATFTRYELTRAINRHLPDYLGGLHAERVEAVLEQMTDMALDPQAGGPVRLLNAPDEVAVPVELQRPDGRSVYLAQASERYTTVDQLDREADLMNRALGHQAPRLTAERAGEVIGLSVEQAKQALLRGEAVPEIEGHRPFSDQAEAIRGVLTSGRNVDVLIGAAGTGKSFTMSRLASIWRAETGTPALGLTLGQNAAGVLRGEGLDQAMNIARWLEAVDSGDASVMPGQLVIVDEASMVPTEDLARIQQLADAARAKVIWTGDHAQLSAPEAGGAMRSLVEVGGSHQLTTVVRFREGWEREASVKLRDGMREALTEYDHHGRLAHGTREQMETAALNGYLADYLQGRQTLLLAGTNEKAAELSNRVREELVALGRVTREGVRLHDGNLAGRGDLIMARRNMELEDDQYELTNRDVLRVVEVDSEGRIFATVDTSDGAGETVELPASYVRNYVELGYSGTVHAAQGRTVDTCHAVPDASTTRESLYVMMTRGRDANLAYVPVDPEREADLRPGPEQARERSAEVLRGEAGSWNSERPPLGHQAPSLAGDAISVLSAVLEQQEADQTATEALVEEGERPRHLGHLGAMWTDQIREHAGDAYIARAEAAGVLSEADAARLQSDEARGTLGRMLHQLDMAGHDADRILAAAITLRELDTAESPAQVLHWRISQAAKERGIDLDRLEVSEEQIAGTWRDRTPTTGRAVTDQFLGELADRAQLRQAELGQDALQSPPEWLVEAMGAPDADDLAERAGWAARAEKVMGYREQYGYTSETDPIGPAPSRKSPEQRAAWWAAHDALGRPDTSREITGATDGELWVMRAAYQREAQWAPPHVGEELGQVSREARERAAEAARLRARAASVEPRDAAAAAALSAQAEGQQVLAGAASARREVLSRVHEARQAWHQTTQDTALLAMRADAELRRRDHIDADRLPPLHADTADAQHRIQQQRQAEAARQAAEQQPQIPAGQLELDLGGAVERVAAWERPAAAVPEPSEATREAFAERDQQLAEVAAWERARAAWVRGELDQLPERPAAVDEIRQSGRDLDLEAEAAAAAAQRQQHQADKDAERRSPVEPPAQRPEPQPEIEATAAAPVVGQGQLALDVFGEGGSVDRETDPQLADAADKAAAAAGIAEVRQADKDAERAAEDERRRAEREQQHQVDERARERAEIERAKLEARQAAERAEREREREAWEIARDAFPHGIQPRSPGYDPGYNPPPPPQSPGRGEGLGL
jgi:conjugative relaxase-like TrwC/TraI family protein